VTDGDGDDDDDEYLKALSEGKMTNYSPTTGQVKKKIQTVKRNTRQF
jgi:hypothetical protein